MPFDVDVFVSYSSADRAWADRMNASLTAPGSALTTFFDAKSLRAGDDWEAKLEQAVESARHLVVLWTDLAKASDWVTRECMTFNLRAQPEKDNSRRLIFVNLQGVNQAFRRFQHLTPDAALQSAYAAGQAAPQRAWDAMVADLRAGLDPNSRPLPVALAVLTLTQAELGALDAKRWKWIESDLRISRSRLLGRYGATREAWTPFSTPDSITEVLNDTRTQFNLSFNGRSAVWRMPDADFWEDTVAARKFVEQEFNTSELSLLVIDPVAIYHPDVYQRLMLFHESLTRAGTVVATLAPFGLPRRIAGLKKALLDRGTPYFDDYFQPVVPPRRRVLAQCGMTMSDGDDIRRHLLAAAGLLVPEVEAKSRSTYLQHGSGP